MSRLVSLIVLVPLLGLVSCAPATQLGYPEDMELVPIDPFSPILRAEDLEGRVAVVTFFDPQCVERDRFGRVQARVVACHLWLQAVQETVRQVRSNDVHAILVLAAATRELDPAVRHAVITYLQRYNLTLPTYFDRQGRLAHILPARPVATHVLDREGKRVYTRRGARPPSERELRELREAIEAARS